MMRISANQMDDHILLLREMENNMRAKLRFIPTIHPDMNVTEFNSTLIVDSGLPSDTFNTAFGGTIDEETAQHVFNFYTNKHHPCAWWVGPSSDSEMTTSNLKNAGFEHDECDVGMVANLTLLKDLKRSPDGLHIKKCETKADFEDFGDVLASVFSPYPEEEQVRKYYQNMTKAPIAQQTNLQLFLGYLNGKAVSTAGLFLTNCAGIFDISTRPEHRCKGLGTALFHHALKNAVSQGFEVAVLQASPDGLGIYETYGFQKLGVFNVWSNAHALTPKPST